MHMQGCQTIAWWRPHTPWPSATTISLSRRIITAAPSPSEQILPSAPWPPLPSCEIFEDNCGPLHTGVSEVHGLQPADAAKYPLGLSKFTSDHCCAGRLLRDQELDCNFLWRLSEGEQRQIRRIVMDMVLATDMKQHFALVAKFRVLVTHGPRASQTSKAHMSS